MQNTEQYQIHKAALASDYESALKLINVKADLNELDSDGHTALHWAVFRGDVKFVKILLEAGANPNVISSDGVSPKWRAKDFGLNEIDNLLDSYGGKILTSEDFNKTAFAVFNNAIGQPLPQEDIAEEKFRNRIEKKKWWKFW